MAEPPEEERPNKQMQAGAKPPVRMKVGTPEGLPAEVGDLHWEDAADKAYLNALPTVRAAAEKWAGLTGLIIGAFGFASFTDGRDDVQSLTTAWEILAGGAALLGLLIALVAVVLAGLAAQGTPKQVLEGGEDLRLRSLRDARSARSRLRLSRVGTTIAVLLLLLALGVLWYAPTDSEQNRPTFSIEIGSGGAVCGQLKSLTDKEIVLDVGDGAEVKLSPPRTMRRVNRCE